MKKEQKMYVIKKYVMASSAHEALRKEKRTPVQDCWVDDEPRKSDNLANLIGFSVER